MTDTRIDAEVENENEIYPVEPRYHPIHKIPRKIYDFLASAKLAMVLLVVILSSCLAGVTIIRGMKAWELIFNSLWFNGLLILLVVNVACCFFGRIWRRRVTIISFGMILFHLSFVVILLAIVYNSLFYFRGIVRLTEGEVLPSSDWQSYDAIEKGRFFNASHLKGETSLIKMHTGYKVSGEDKRAAYEISVGEENSKSQGIIYLTRKLTHRGVDYFNDREGYSLMLMLSDQQGQDLYGVHVPLQSNVLGKNRVEYFTGITDNHALKKENILFPAPPERPLFGLKAEYFPTQMKERSGEVSFQIITLDKDGQPNRKEPIVEGKTAIGEKIKVGNYFIQAKEVRYWVAMMVRYEPGKPIVLTSLWIGLAGMILTTIGRIVRSKK